MGESDLPRPLFGHWIQVYQKQQKSSGALWCSEGGSIGTEEMKVTVSPLKSCPSSLTQLKHVQNGIVHLDQYGQVDRQAGLAVLGGRGARQPGEGIVLLQYKPVFEKKKFF